MKLFINDLSKITYGTKVTLETEVEYKTTSDGYLYLQSGTNDYVACFFMDMNNPTSNAHFFPIKCTSYSADNDSTNAIFVRKGTVLKKQGGSGTATFIPLT